MLLKFSKYILPWLITLGALWYAFSGLDWKTFLDSLLNANFTYLFLAITLTILSYLLRGIRWKFLFSDSKKISSKSAIEVLFLGFFMNNILPARAGEFVRAHFGAKKFELRRTLVLATIAGERLIDGLTISAFFLLFASNLAPGKIGYNLNLVGKVFFLAALLVFIVLITRKPVFKFSTSIANKLNNKFVSYLNTRVQTFIDGLRPIYQIKKFPSIAAFSLLIWLIEIGVFASICKAYGAYFSFGICILFMVSVNFSSLIPSAPGAIGVIEAIASAVLVSVGEPKEKALAMVLAQHIIQYLVVCLPGFFIMLKWNLTFKQFKQDKNNE